jgi:DNA-binding beta-propeller fold protein YncE
MIVNYNSFIWLILCCFGISSCNSVQKEKVSFGEFDMSTPEEFNMPESLFEISGIAFNNGNSDTVYAIQDEEGKLFRLGWKNNKQLHTKFARKGDYEDVAILKNQAVILKSNGFLYTMPLSESVYEESELTKEWKKLLPKGEYEGMYADNATDNLYILCKNCPQDDSKNSITGYILNPLKDSMNIKSFSVHVDEIKAITGKASRGFRPSGLAQNPKTGDWYILSAVNKLLVITDKQWKVKDAFPLSGNVFTQPEGIAFDNAGNLYISNEGDDLSNGNILKFKNTAH